MKLIYKEFSRECESLFKREARILVAVSGGVDSMVLLDLLLNEWGSDKLAVAHCNFGLRGEEADGETFMVEEFCRVRGVECFVVRFDTYKECYETGETVQVAARRLRYGFFDRICDERGFQYIAVAHNLNDVSETFFINLMRGSGVRGLLSIPRVNGRVVRPLLFASRERILQYAAENNLPFRNDSSNNDTHYLRNKLRHNVLPQLREIDSRFDLLLKRNIENLRSGFEFEQAIIERVRQSVFEKDNNAISISKFLSQVGAGAYLLFRLLENYDFSAEIAGQLFENLQNTKNQGSIYLSPSNRATIDRGYVIIEPLGAQIPNAIYLSRQEVQIIPFSPEIDPRSTPKRALFDLHKLTFPLILRPWQAGDTLKPFGMKGRSQKVSDLLTNAKLSRFEKEKIQVLISGEEIIWVVGLRTSEYAKITVNTQEVAIISL